MQKFPKMLIISALCKYEPWVFLILYPAHICFLVSTFFWELIPFTKYICNSEPVLLKPT